VVQEFPVQNISHLRRAPFDNYEAKQLKKNKSESSPDGILSFFFFPV